MVLFPITIRVVARRCVTSFALIEVATKPSQSVSQSGKGKKKKKMRAAEKWQLVRRSRTIIIPD
jgi:hypothetical protein